MAVERVGTKNPPPGMNRARILHTSQFRATLSSVIPRAIPSNRTSIPLARKLSGPVSFSWTALRFCACRFPSAGNGLRGPRGRERVLAVELPELSANSRAPPRPGGTKCAPLAREVHLYSRHHPATGGVRRTDQRVAASHLQKRLPRRFRERPRAGMPPLPSIRHVPTAGGSLSQPARIFSWCSVFSVQLSVSPATRGARTRPHQTLWTEH
jgi:hypothetical protein